nr:MAG TPA: hypothetical protein [Caudoviricetes sp.]DAO41969.1 MAG TPA: hypothetical protein [Caudoviricetes sp.]
MVLGVPYTILVLYNSLKALVVPSNLVTRPVRQPFEVYEPKMDLVPRTP